MNKQQRKIISDAQSDLDKAIDNMRTILGEMEEGNKKARFEQEDMAPVIDALSTALENIANVYSDIASEEEEKYDNLTENLQQTERGQNYQANADTFSTAEDDANGLCSEIDHINGWSENVYDDLIDICDRAEELTSIDGE